MKMLTTCAMLTGALAIQGSAWAALSPDEIARLGNDLLPWGAETGCANWYSICQLKL